MATPRDAAPTPRSSSLRTRLGIVAVVFLTLVLIAAGLSALMVRAWNRSLDERSDARIAADDVAELRLAYSDQETGVRGYQLSSDPQFLDPYRTGSVLAGRITARLADRDDVPGLDDALAAVVAAAENWQEDIAGPTIADPADAPDEALALERFDQLRAELDDLDDLVNQELDRLVARTNRARALTFGVLVGSAAVAVAGTVLVTILFRRWVTRPVAEISTAARALAHDDSSRLPDTDTSELQDVTDAIRALQQSLVSARDDAVRAYDALEQSAVLALHVRAELADEIGEMPQGWSAHSTLLPAEGVVAGDCFDIGLLDADHLYLVMIDVTGHGAGAALDALTAKSQLRAALRSRMSPGPALEWLSGQRSSDDGSDLLTAFVMLIELPTGRCEFANAGHPAAFVTDGEQLTELGPTGPLVGAFTANWRTDRCTIPGGTTLFVYTDGVTDTIGEDRERFGDDRLRSRLDRVDPVELVEHVRTACEDFRRGGRSDDLTMIALHRQADPSGSGPDTVLP